MWWRRCSSVPSGLANDRTTPRSGIEPACSKRPSAVTSYAYPPSNVVAWASGPSTMWLSTIEKSPPSTRTRRRMYLSPDLPSLRGGCWSSRSSGAPRVAAARVDRWPPVRSAAASTGGFFRMPLPAFTAGAVSPFSGPVPRGGLIALSPCGFVGSCLIAIMCPSFTSCGRSGSCGSSGNRSSAV